MCLFTLSFRTVEARDIDSPGARVTGRCEPPMSCVLVIELEGSGRAVLTLSY